MKKIIFIALAIALLLLASCSKNSGELKWFENVDEAIADAKKNNNVVLVNFTGSDWCKWCEKLREEVFETKEFNKYASRNLSIVMLDFPRVKAQSAKTKNYNKSIANKFNVKGFPTIILLNKNGDMIFRTGYKEGGANNYITHLKDAIDFSTTNRTEAITKYNLTWHRSLEYAKELAAKESKQVFVNFTGSDWCKWCETLGSEVLSKDEFKEYADSNLILVEVDYPRNIEQSNMTKEYNERLKNEFGVAGFPSIILLSSTGKILGKTGYLAGGVVNYVEHLKEFANFIEDNKMESRVDEYGNKWLLSYEKAKEAALEENKKIFINFTGSDWCEWCEKLRHEVFEKASFVNFAKDNLILLEVDFPKEKKISEARKSYNMNIAQTFGVQGLPTVAIVDETGRQLGVTGYQEGGAEKYIKHIKSFIK